jgi:prefoldin subunit 5
MERLGEVRGRLEIVNKRRGEYEEAIVRLEREIEEIRAIAEELRPELPPVEPVEESS